MKTYLKIDCKVVDTKLAEDFFKTKKLDKIGEKLSYDIFNVIWDSNDTINFDENEIGITFLGNLKVQIDGDNIILYHTFDIFDIEKARKYTQINTLEGIKEWLRLRVIEIMKNSQLILLRTFNLSGVLIVTMKFVEGICSHCHLGYEECGCLACACCGKLMTAKTACSQNCDYCKVCCERIIGHE